MTAAPAPLNRLRQLWREGRPTFGAIATIPSIPMVQIMARSGMDWIIVDLEHGPIDLGSAHGMIVATSGSPCVPLVRIAANEPWLAKAPMDLGALGINFPMICSPTEAEKAVRSVRYPPRGDRLWGPFHAPFRWGVSMPEYMASADDDMICMITIEHVEVVKRIDEWSEEDRHVLWFHFPNEEPPYCGTPLDDDFDAEWHQWWMPLPDGKKVHDAIAALRPTEGKQG